MSTFTRHCAQIVEAKLRVSRKRGRSRAILFLERDAKLFRVVATARFVYQASERLDS